MPSSSPVPRRASPDTLAGPASASTGFALASYSTANRREIDRPADVRCDRPRRPNSARTVCQMSRISTSGYSIPRPARGGVQGFDRLDRNGRCPRRPHRSQGFPRRPTPRPGNAGRRFGSAPDLAAAADQQRPVHVEQHGADARQRLQTGRLARRDRLQRPAVAAKDVDVGFGRRHDELNDQVRIRRKRSNSRNRARIFSPCGNGSSWRLPRSAAA